MKHLSLALEVSNFGETTHVWFPTTQAEDEKIKTWFNPAPTEIQTEKEYGNKIAYFYFSKKDSKITAYFPVLKIKSSFDNGEKFLHPNRFVQSDDNVIKKLSETFTKNFHTDEEKARRFFDFVVDYLTYANPIRGLYSSLQALTDRGVDCGGFSTLLVALLRAVNIPARCVFGWAIQSKLGYHAWVEYYDRQKQVWVPADPSVAHLGTKTKLDAGFGFINDDRVTLSVGEDIDLIGEKIRWSTPLLQSPVVISLNESGLPVSTSEKLSWSVVLKGPALPRQGRALSDLNI
ncbi:MAG: transglutaminase domain-containing protein [Parcubacteria group bacterium]|nr:transglutaminase domain-containing protein [Parcubacteria group bacterium]